MKIDANREIGLLEKEAKRLNEIADFYDGQKNYKESKKHKNRSNALDYAIGFITAGEEAAQTTLEQIAGIWAIQTHQKRVGLF